MLECSQESMGTVLENLLVMWTPEHWESRKASHEQTYQAEGECYQDADMV